MINSILKYLKWLLLPLGLIHQSIIWLRNFLYDYKILKAQRLSRPVISIGNIQMGGTGKTPLVIELLKLLQQDRRNVAVLTRGYKRESRGNRILTFQRFETFERLGDIGDEPALILQNLNDGVLGVGANRYEVVQEVLQQYPVDIVLLDDGFQYRQLHRDLDICLIDVSRWANHPFLFPFSYLRDSKGSLRRADLIILTKSEFVPEKAAALKFRLEKRFGIPVLAGRFEFKSLNRLSDGAKISIEQIKTQKVAAICGIANPGNFFELLQNLGVNPAYRRAFPDHHAFIPADIAESKAAGVDWIIVTEKDAVKLAGCLLDDLKETLLVLKVGFYLQDEEILEALLSKALQPW